MNEPVTTTCDACGREYEFTSHKDRCPVCCPKPEPEPDAYDRIRITLMLGMTGNRP